MYVLYVRNFNQLKQLGVGYVSFLFDVVFDVRSELEDSHGHEAEYKFGYLYEFCGVF